MSVTIVVAMGKNRVIGIDGDLPWRLPADLAHFKRLTMGHVLVMGRATFDSIGRPLPGRTTIVVTRNPDWRHDGVLVAPSLTAALTHAKRLDSEVFLVGGGQIYAQALAEDLVDRMIITEVELDVRGDTWFPAFDAETWPLLAEEHYPAVDGYPAYRFVTRERKR